MVFSLYNDEGCCQDKRDLKHRLKITVINKDVLNEIYRDSLLCDMSYKNPQELRMVPEWKALCLYNYKEVFLHDRGTDLQGYIWTRGNTVHLVFRGTNSLKDAMINLDLTQEDIGGGVCIHRGFYRQFKSVEEIVYNSIGPGIEKVNVSGHSLGGGIACIAAAIIADRHKDVFVSCCTFGCPRVGNLRFKEFFKKNVKNYYRVHIKDDPISMVPSLCNYHHVCRGICIGDDMTIDYKKDVKWYKRFFHCVSNVDYINPFDGHRTATYVDRIKMQYTYL